MATKIILVIFFLINVPWKHCKIYVSIQKIINIKRIRQIMWKIVETKNYTKVTQANNTVFISSQINALSIYIMYL